MENEPRVEHFPSVYDKGMVRFVVGMNIDGELSLSDYVHGEIAELPEKLIFWNIIIFTKNDWYMSRNQTDLIQKFLKLIKKC